MNQPKTASPAHRHGLRADHASVRVAAHWSFWRKLLAYLGPGYLVAVGYMDPGNWATDIAGGSALGYELLWVLLMSNLMALLMQSHCIRLGIVCRKDLAQASKAYYPKIINEEIFIFITDNIDKIITEKSF